MNRHDSQHAESFRLLKRDSLRYQFSEDQVKKHQQQRHAVVCDCRTVGNLQFFHPAGENRRDARSRRRTGIETRKSDRHLNRGEKPGGVFKEPLYHPGFFVPVLCQRTDTVPIDRDYRHFRTGKKRIHQSK